MDIFKLIQTLQEKGKGAPAPKPTKPAKLDPDMAKVAHYVHAMTLATPTEREIVRRYSRKEWGELPAEATLGVLPVLPVASKPVSPTSPAPTAPTAHPAPTGHPVLPVLPVRPVRRR
jgi:hypothetical protein